ncbi:hypothetical protein [Dactylosporangium salmoneum]|uniref:Uncharacterized protein n=1 Tax=Dactylosporangium salmoneum TaxID=53361 RepID=A0ABP5T1G7_9ACTN
MTLVNLSEAQDGYRRAIADCKQALATAEPVGGCRSAALGRIEAVRKAAMRSVDAYTTRRFMPVNTRRGLVAKLDRLHHAALAELDLITGAV